MLKLLLVKSALRVQLGLGSAEWLHTIKAEQKLGPAPVNSVLFSGHLQGSWWTFHAFVKNPISAN